MKQSLFLSALGLLAMALMATSCSPDAGGPTSANAPVVKAQAPSITPAKPELAYAGRLVKREKGRDYGYQTVAVMDADGTRQTNLYVGSTASDQDGFSLTGGTMIGNVTWSPDGRSIAWTEHRSLTPNSYLIKALDVSVNSKGEAVASNVRTICTTGAQVIGLAWCSVSGTARLAYTSNTNDNGWNAALYTVPQTGGTPTLVKSSTDAFYHQPTWSPDDSKIALTKSYDFGQTQNTSRLWVVDATNGLLLQDHDLTALPNATGCEWARSGNTIAFNSSGSIYYFDYGSSTGHYTHGVVGGPATWSPDNSSLIYVAAKTTGGYELRRVAAFGTTFTSIADGRFSSVEWKR